MLRRTMLKALGAFLIAPTAAGWLRAKVQVEKAQRAETALPATPGRSVQDSNDYEAPLSNGYFVSRVRGLFASQSGEITVILPRFERVRVRVARGVVLPIAAVGIVPERGAPYVLGVL